MLIRRLVIEAADAVDRDLKVSAAARAWLDAAAEGGAADLDYSAVVATIVGEAAQLLCVANAAANTGARVETDPSIRPARPGCTIWSTNSRRLARSSSSLTWGRSLSSLNSWTRSSCVRSV